MRAFLNKAVAVSLTVLTLGAGFVVSTNSAEAQTRFEGGFHRFGGFDRFHRIGVPGGVIVGVPVRVVGGGFVEGRPVFHRFDDFHRFHRFEVFHPL